MLRVGLTGGIASGKSAVSALLEEMGALVLDADRIAREVLEPGRPAFDAAVARFGPGILGTSGEIDRRALAAVVFADAGARRDLEAIVHPAVIAEIERRIAAAESEGRAPVAVVDAALLVESGYHRRLDRLIVLRCRIETQVARLRKRGLALDEALERIRAQALLESKLAAADHVVDTDVPMEETRAQVEAVWKALLEEARGGAAGPRRV